MELRLNYLLCAMGLNVASLNSGSNGNCYYIDNNSEAVLIDAGLSCREIVKRMQRLGLEMEKVKAVFISHEHSDHIRGVEVLSRRFTIPVYINTPTLQSSGLKLREDLLALFENETSFNIGGLKIKAFKKHHDAASPYSFNISGNGVTVGVYTDIGHACKNIVAHFKECHAVFLEANYDEEMLNNGDYPIQLKRRIKSDRGHLSNAQALDLFTRYRAPHLSHLFLSHLSRENNEPGLVMDLFSAHAGSTLIKVASRHEESEVYYINRNPRQENGSEIKPDVLQPDTVINGQLKIMY